MKKKEKGQGLVEFILVMPALLMLIALVIDASYIMWVRVSIQNGASEGGRAAQVWRPNNAGTTCLGEVQAAVARTTHFAHSVTVSTDGVDCVDAAPLDRIPRRTLIEVKVVNEHTPLLSMIFFSPPLWIPLESTLEVSHE